MSFENLHVIFFQVKSSHQKIERIITVANEHFKKKEKLLFMVSDDASQKFVDELLWKEPPFSFLYHKVSEVECNDLIVICKGSLNLNSAPHVFNLTAIPVFLPEPCIVVYDFDDNTLGKEVISKNKFSAYREKGCRIESSF